MADRQHLTSDQHIDYRGYRAPGPLAGHMRIPEEGAATLPHRPPPTMAYPVHSTAHRSQQSARVRALWETFERGLASAQRTAQHKTLAAHEDADRAYNALPLSSRPSPAQHAASKEAKARDMARALYGRLVQDWHSRLANAGLTAEMWTDITPQEMDRVAKALGAGEGAAHDSPAHVKAPSLSITARNNNASSASWHSTTSSASGASYAFVKPSELNSEEEDDAYFSPHTPFSGSSAAHPYSEPASPALSFHSANASASENDADDDEDAPGTGRRDPFASWVQPAAESSTSWNAHSRRTTLTAHPYTSASGSTSASASASMASLSAASAHSPHNTHPELSAHVKNNHEKFAFPSNGHGQRTASSSSASSSHSYSHEAQSHSASQSRSTEQRPARVPQPYIGPSLLTTDDEDGDPASLNSANGHSSPLTGPEAEAAAVDFDRFKLTTRMRMIVEFHVAAAAAEIKVAGEIWRLRRGLPRKPNMSENGAGKATTPGGKVPKANGKGKESNGRNTTSRKLDLLSKGKAKQANSQNGSLVTNGDGNHSDTSSDEAYSGDEQDARGSTPAELVVAHQSAMSALQAAKEAERRAVVKEERDKRRAELLAGISKSKNATEPGSLDGPNNTAAGKDGKIGKKDDRRKGRSGTLISGQPANVVTSSAQMAKETSEEPWLSAALHAEGSSNGREDDGSLEKALGATFDSSTILSGGGVDAFLDGILTSKHKAVAVKDSAWSSEASQPSPWGAQNTPTAATFGNHPPPPHRRRASTSASASAAAAAMAASAVASHTTTNGHGPRRVHAPVPVRAAPFGELSASSSDESSEAAPHWGSSATGQNGYTQGQARAERGYVQPPNQHAPFVRAPPLQELERELDPELMAAFVQYSGLANKEGGSGSVALGGVNVSSGSTGSNVSSNSSGSYMFPYSNGNSSVSSSNNSMLSGSSSNGHNNGMFNAQGGAGINNPYNAAAAAFSGAEYEAGLGRGGGRNAYVNAAQALMNSGGIPVSGLQMAPAANEQGWNTMRGSQGNPAADGHGHAPAGRSRSRSPTMTHSFPSWAARMTGSSHGQPPMEQQQPQHYQQQSHAFPQQSQVKDYPARGPTATPIAGGWTRKFQKSAATNSNPQPQVSSGSSMFGLRNPFGFSDDTEHAAPPTSSTSTGTSWLRKATGAAAPVQEPEVSIWEQVTQQKAKVGLAANASSGSSSTKKAMGAVQSPSPPLSVPIQATEKTVDATMTGKKQLKKQRQVVANKGGKAAFEAAADPEPESEVSPPGAWTSGSVKFATQPTVDDVYNENEPDYNEKGMFARPSKVRGGPPVTTIGRQRLNSISNSGGWDTEAGAASTPRPGAKIPAHLQSLAASMSTPPPFGLKPLMNDASQTQPTERPGTGLGMNSNTVRARGNSITSAWGSASNVNGSGTASTQNGGSTGRSLWGLFGGGSSNDAASKPHVAGWGDPSGANEEAGDIELGDEGVGIGDDDWTPISRGSAQPEKTQTAPVSLTQRLGRRGSEAVSPLTTSEPSKTAAATTAASKNANGANGKKVGKGKKVMIEDVPDEETESRGETLPANSRHIFDDAESSGILGPKPSVPPATYDSIISYTDEESERKPVAAPTVAPSEDWMEVAAKEMKEAAAKKKAAEAGGSGAWGINVSKPSPEPIPPAPAAVEEEVKAPPPEPVNTPAKGGKQPAANTGKGKKKGKR